MSRFYPFKNSVVGTSDVGFWTTHLASRPGKWVVFAKPAIVALAEALSGKAARASASACDAVQDDFGNLVLVG